MLISYVHASRDTSRVKPTIAYTGDDAVETIDIELCYSSRTCTAMQTEISAASHRRPKSQASGTAHILKPLWPYKHKQLVPGTQS